MILTMDGFERGDGFEALLGDVLRERANAAVPAGLVERVMERVVGEPVELVVAGSVDRAICRSFAAGEMANPLALGHVDVRPPGISPRTVIRGFCD